MGTTSVGRCFKPFQLIDRDQKSSPSKSNSNSFQGMKGDHLSNLAWLNKIGWAQHWHRISGFEVGLTSDQTTAIADGDSHGSWAAHALSSRMGRDVRAA